MKKISKVASIILVSSAIFLAGCGSSSNDNNEESISSTTVQGKVVDEIIANGVVKVHKNSISGEVIAATRTDENGSYSVNVNYKGPVIVEVSCDENSTFVEENGSLSKCDLNTSLLSVNIADGTTIEEHVTPITTQLVALLTKGDVNKSITQEDLQRAKRIVSYIYGIDPIITDPTQNHTYNRIIEVLHEVANENNLSMNDIISSLIDDVKDDKIGNNSVIEKFLNNLQKYVKSPLFENNITISNGIDVEDINTTIPYDGIVATKMVIQSLRDNLYSISNDDKNGTLDKEVRDFNLLIKRDVIENTENELDIFGHVLGTAFDPDVPMNDCIVKDGNYYCYKVEANNENTEFNYTISYKDVNYTGTIITSQDYKDTHSPDDLKSNMYFEVNGSLPSDDNKTIYAKATAVKNNDNTFTFNLVDANIKGDNDYLQIKNITIDGKYFTYIDNDENSTNTDLYYIRFYGVELNSIIGNKFEINGTLSLDWVQNSYIKNAYPVGEYEEVDWLQVVVTCKRDDNFTAPSGGEVILNFNGTQYTLSQKWQNNEDMGFEIEDPNNLALSDKEGDIEAIVKNYENYNLTNIQCPSGFTPEIESINVDTSDNFANYGYVPNEISFVGNVKDIVTNIELNGSINISSPDIQNIDLTKDKVMPTIYTNLNVVLRRPNYPDTLVNADFKYYNDKTSSLDMSYSYNDNVITLLGNWNEDESGEVKITDANGVKIIIPVNTDGNIEFDETSVIYNGVEVGKLEERGDNFPVIHFNDGETISIY